MLCTLLLHGGVVLPLRWHSYGHCSLQCDAHAILVVWPLGATVLILDVVHFVDGHTTEHSVVIMLVITGIFFLSPVGCGVPSRPENGSVQSLDISQGTQQGSEIFFTCNTSYVPAGNMITTCASDGMWNPDPATFVCICMFIHCIAALTPWIKKLPASDFTSCTVGR